MRYSIRHFIHHEATAGVLLMIAAVVALTLANSPLADAYHAVLATKITFGSVLDGTLYGLEKSLILWINDGLMAVFFLMVGLEIKRELVIGELSTKAKALQPLFAALGGMIMPALIFIALNFGNDETMRGWAIPCATDIAFALGVLTLIGARVPVSMKILLTAIAILDDLGAILIIAFFYTETLQLSYMAVALVGGFTLMMLNRFNVQRLTAYLLAGLIVWIGLLKAGIHPTLAGVVTALAVPLHNKRKEVKQTSPLMRLEHGLHPWVVFAIMPVFALANAGLPLAGIALSDLMEKLPLGIALGLLVGKPLGIVGGLWMGHFTGIARKPAEIQWGDYWSIAFLCGIGFTMALFITELAFHSERLVEDAKLGVLSASLLSAAIGWLLSRLNLPYKK